jgi:hypothetical protein
MPTSTWTATSAATWVGGSSPRWRSGSEANRAYQGQWQNYGLNRGLWFFNSANIRSTLSGQIIRRVRVRLTRFNGGGYSSGQTPTIRLHNYDSPPAGQPAVQAGYSNHGVTWAWGETKWATLPISWGAALRDNDSKGIGLYTSSNHPYMIFTSGAILEVTYDPLVTAPGTPTGLSFPSVGQDFVQVSWNLVSGATAYRYQREDLTYSWLVDSPPRTQSAGVETNTIYRYRVRAENSAGASAWTAYASAPRTLPATPGRPSVESTTSTSITIGWPGLGVNYDVERNGSVVSTNQSPRVYTADSLSTGSSHTFRVRSRNATGVSPWSPSLTATTSVPAPSQPTGLVANLVTETSIRIRWNASTYASGYDVRRDLQTVSSNQTGTSYTSSGLQDSRKYTFDVRARNATGVSSWSTIEVTTSSFFDDPLAPSGVGPSGISIPNPTLLTASIPSHPVGLLQTVQWQTSSRSDFYPEIGGFLSTYTHTAFTKGIGGSPVGAFHSGSDFGLVIWFSQSGATVHSAQIESSVSATFTVRLRPWSTATNSATGSPVASRTVSVGPGINTVILGMQVPASGTYFLYREGSNSLMRSGDNFPFSSYDGVVSRVLNGASLAGSVFQRWYYFFNMVISSPGFVSAGTVSRTANLTSGYRYIRARSVDATGSEGPWSATREVDLTRLKVWDGSDWTPRSMKVRTESGWKIATLKYRESFPYWRWS